MKYSIPVFSHLLGAEGEGQRRRSPPWSNLECQGADMVTRRDLRVPEAVSGVRMWGASKREVVKEALRVG